MANTATLATLRDRTRTAADMVNTEFVSDAEINTWLNVGLSALYDIIIGSFDDWVESTSAFNTVANQSDYALPDDFYKLQSLDIYIGSRYYSVPRFMNQERNRLANVPGSFPQGIAYRIVNGVCRLIPLPSSVFQMTMKYAPVFDPLLADADTVNQIIPPGWEEFAVLYAAIQCIIKDEGDTAALEAQRAMIMQRITTMADDRDAYEPARVVDVTKGYGRAFGWGNQWWGDY